MDQDARLGHHRILRPLGQGGMGEVSLALDIKLNREVAMRVRPRSTLVENWFQEFEERE